MSVNYTLDLRQYSEGTIMQLYNDGVISKEEYANELKRRGNESTTENGDRTSPAGDQVSDNSKQLRNTTLSGSQSSDDAV